jgi:hypothetical protein
MKAVLTILFPWQGTFKQLGLRNRWWHRLAVVAFFIALVPVLGTSCVLAFGSLQPVHSYMPDIQYWAMDRDGNSEQVTLGPPVTQAQYDATVKQHKEDAKGYSTPLPVGTQVLMSAPEVPIDYSAPLKAKVDMPDGTTGEFVGKSEAEITAVWNKALHKAVRNARLLSIGIVIAVTLAFSYLLQSLYRTLLYVVYGSAKDRDLTHSGEPA